MKTGRPHTGYPLYTAAAVLLVFLVLFPKGGFKVAGIPLTFGYFILLFEAALCFMFYSTSGKILRIGKNQFICLVSTLPFILLSTFKILTTEGGSLGFTISFFVSLVFMPLAFLVLFYHPLRAISLDAIIQVLCRLVFIAACYGIILFFYTFFTGEFFEIPLLTTNLDDVEPLKLKHNNRDGIFKLASTFNNGNLYGICMLMLLPIFDNFEPRRLRKLVFKLSLLLTLSRTVWAGLLLYEVLNLLFLKQLKLTSLMLTLATFFAIFLGITYALYVLNYSHSFLLDFTLGDRVQQFSALATTSFLPDFDTEFNGIGEMVYFSIASSFGWLSLFLFLIYLFTPVCLFLARKTTRTHIATRRCLALGLSLYYFVAFADGAILLIPVMAIYWMIVALLLVEEHPGTA